MKKYIFIFIVSVVLALMAIPLYGGMGGQTVETEASTFLDAESNPLLKGEGVETDEAFENPFLTPIDDAKSVVEEIPNANPDDYNVEEIPTADPDDFKVEVLPNASVEFEGSVNLNPTEESIEVEGFKEVEYEGVTY